MKRGMGETLGLGQGKKGEGFLDDYLKAIVEEQKIEISTTRGLTKEDRK